MIAEFALFVFTTLGGVAVGLYASSALCTVEGRRHNLMLTIIPLILLCIGGIALMLHLGHPERMLNAFSNLQAGIAMEGVSTVVFGGIVFIDCILTIAKRTVPRALRILGAIAGLALCSVMGYAYYSYEAVAMWHTAATIPFFVLCDVACGGLLFGALMEEGRKSTAFVLTETVFAAIAVSMFLIETAVASAVGKPSAPYVAATVLAIAAVVFVARSGSAKKAGGPAPAWTAFALMFVALVVARYAFYSVI